MPQNIGPHSVGSVLLLAVIQMRDLIQPAEVYQATLLCYPFPNMQHVQEPCMYNAKRMIYNGVEVSGAKARNLRVLCNVSTSPRLVVVHADTVAKVCDSHAVETIRTSESGYLV